RARTEILRQPLEQRARVRALREPDARHVQIAPVLRLDADVTRLKAGRHFVSRLSHRGLLLSGSVPRDAFRGGRVHSTTGSPTELEVFVEKIGCFRGGKRRAILNVELRIERSARMQILGLVGWIAVVAIAAVIGSVASANAPEFYGQLDAPSWAPPASVFGPVWTVLYLLMALAAWLVWRAYGWHGARAALTLFLVQLAA